MSYQPKKHPQNVPGKFYVTEDCLACESGQDAAPNNFRYGENGLSSSLSSPTLPKKSNDVNKQWIAVRWKRSAMMEN
jgi:hypothetical protein